MRCIQKMAAGYQSVGTHKGLQQVPSYCRPVRETSQAGYAILNLLISSICHTRRESTLVPKALPTECKTMAKQIGLPQAFNRRQAACDQRKRTGCTRRKACTRTTKECMQYAEIQRCSCTQVHLRAVSRMLRQAHEVLTRQTNIRSVVCLDLSTQHQGGRLPG